MVKINYHLGELAISRNPADPRHNMPEIPDWCRSILDVGCGAGQTLIDLNPKIVSRFGVDIDKDALFLGKQLANAINFVNGSVHQLPFKENSFDMVISRVSLSLTDIPCSLESIHTVLKPAGLLWMSLYSFSIQKRLLMDCIRRREIKSVIYNTYAVVNGLILHFLGKTYHFPFRPEKFISFQSSSRMTKLLIKNGFENILVIKIGAHFNMTAQKKVNDKIQPKGLQMQRID